MRYQIMIEEKEVDKEVPDTADDFVTFDGGLYEFDTNMCVPD